ICGWGYFLGFTARSIACDTMLRPRSSGARVRAWFCMRGRSLEERAIVSLRRSRVPRRGYCRQDTMRRAVRHNATVLAANKNGGNARPRLWAMAGRLGADPERRPTPRRRAAPRAEPDPRGP